MKNNKKKTLLLTSSVRFIFLGTFISYLEAHQRCAFGYCAQSYEHTLQGRQEVLLHLQGHSSCPGNASAWDGKEFCHETVEERKYRRLEQRREET